MPARTACLFDALRALFFSFVLLVALVPLPLRAQEVVWVQIEAQPTLAEARARAQRYAAQLEDVNGFAMGGGWYAIALGPYLRPDAEQVLRVYRSQGRIPRDSYIAFTAGYQQQFWPIGADVLNRGVIAPPAASTPPLPDPATPTPEPSAPQSGTDVPVTTLPDETPREARASEARLTAQERRDLQIALQWAGFYRAAIDGAFGRGTRASMADWQTANGHEPTGILTTRQRAELLAQYNAVLNGLGLQTVADTTTGIELRLPLGVVDFEAYEAPFARFSASGQSPAQVLLISQPGDRTTLAGLYDIMQTLEIVPMQGDRELRSDRFTLVGENSRLISQTEVSLRNGEIKGFTLVWPAGDEGRRSRLLNEMRASFSRLPGVMDPAEGTELQDIDLISGLQIRRPLRSRSGLYVDDRGTVVTSIAAVTGCGRVSVDSDHTVSILRTDEATGLAVLQPERSIAPLGVARFPTDAARLQSDVVLSGYSFEGVLGAPTLTFGKLEDIKGLSGDPAQSRLALRHQPGDAGGPVLDATGALLGVLLPRPTSGPQWPRDVSIARDADAVADLLISLGLTPRRNTGTALLDPIDLGKAATAVTALVSCWE